MRIIIPRIPETATQQDLEDFVYQALKPRLFASHVSKSSIQSCRILSADDGQGGTIHNALVEISDKRAASIIIKRLNGKRFKDQQVEVRPYVNRHAWSGVYYVENDRRRINPGFL